MPDPSPPGRWSRESRLLLLTVAVCAGVLFLLARLRFPEPPRVEVSAPPLERLAARASYDALAADIQRVDPEITARVVVLRVASRPPEGPRSASDALAAATGAPAVRHIAALRTDADHAIAFLPASARIDGIVGNDAAGAALLQRDPIRDLALIRVPTVTAPPIRERTLSSLVTPAYVIAVEGTQSGATLRPVFLGQGARFTSIRWNRALLPLGGVAVAPGALIFTLDGEFVGIVDVDGGAPAVVGVRDLFDTAAELAAGPQKVAGDLGVSVQPLTPTLAEALHAQGGVVVSDVDPDGPSASVLAQGDVITALDTTTVTGPDQFLLDVARRPIDQAVQVTFLRAGEQQSASVVIKPVTPRVEPVTVSLVRERGVGTRIDRGGEQVIAGLRPGDLVTRAGDIAAPTPAQLQAALAAPSAGDRFVVLIVVRDGRPLVVAVPRSNGDHDVRH